MASTADPTPPTATVLTRRIGNEPPAEEGGRSRGRTGCPGGVAFPPRAGVRLVERRRRCGRVRRLPQCTRWRQPLVGPSHRPA
eukprot:2653018-Pleurochrysis_carterae.AAC.2